MNCQFFGIGKWLNLGGMGMTWPNTVIHLHRSTYTREHIKCNTSKKNKHNTQHIQFIIFGNHHSKYIKFVGSHFQGISGTKATLFVFTLFCLPPFSTCTQIHTYRNSLTHSQFVLLLYFEQEFLAYHSRQFWAKITPCVDSTNACICNVPNSRCVGVHKIVAFLPNFTN